MATFLGKIAINAERLDTQMYLQSKNIEEALNRWFSDLVHDLENVVKAFSNISWDHATTASIVSLNEKILERHNHKFLDNLIDFQKRAEEIIALKSIQYAKICRKFSRPQNLDDDVRILQLQEGEAYLNKLDTSLGLINRFCAQRLKEAKRLKVDSLSKYRLLFQRLEKFSTLTRSQILSELKEKGEI